MLYLFSPTSPCVSGDPSVFEFCCWYLRVYQLLKKKGAGILIPHVDFGLWKFIFLVVSRVGRRGVTFLEILILLCVKVSPGCSVVFWILRGWTWALGAAKSEAAFRLPGRLPTWHHSGIVLRAVYQNATSSLVLIHRPGGWGLERQACGQGCSPSWKLVAFFFFFFFKQQ